MFEASELADAYISGNVLTNNMRADAQHIAAATVARVDVLVGWNLEHIVNLERIHGYNSVKLRRGYPMIAIRTPRELVADECERHKGRRSGLDAIRPRQDF